MGLSIEKSDVLPEAIAALSPGTLDIKPCPGMVVPVGVRSASEGLTKGLAVESAPLRVNVISPGGVRAIKLSSIGTVINTAARVCSDRHRGKVIIHG